MIIFKNNVFKLDTKNTSYVFSISKLNHLVFQYYGERFFDDNLDFVLTNIPAPNGTTVIYDDDVDPNYSLDLYNLEYSCFGKGDFKNPSLIIDSNGNYMLDLKYHHHKILNNVPILKDMPNIHGDNLECLEITCVDEAKNIEVCFYYIIDYESDVIIRNNVIKNKSNNIIKIKKASSFQLDLYNDDFNLYTLYGAWGMEGHIAKNRIKHLTYLSDSKTGNSSNRRNPLFFLANEKCDDDNGIVYGFNLVYSGNHFELIEHSTFHQVRIQNGINCFQFDYPLNINQSFETPYAIMTYSNKGFNQMARQFHNFVINHVLPVNYFDKNPPIVINNWEATYFKFTYKKVKSIINKGSDFNIELFVLDDGWFSNRNDDFHGLGDYDVNKKKLPFGLKKLAKAAHNKQMLFGIWVEPEACNKDSKLFSNHPDWIIKSKDYKPSMGRHEYILDLTKLEVRNYIIESLDNLLKSAPINYVKWDMNRHISDVENISYFYHDYMIGLYKILKEIKKRHPDVYMEGCASGGNRFDLGMLCYFNSIWASDDTDAFERLHIQKGLAYGYPLRCISSHVSQVPSHSVLRNTSLESRFNSALFANMGYELDLSTLLPYEKKMVKEQVSFYKEYRDVILNGDYYSYKDVDKDNYTLNYVVSKDKKIAIVGVFIGIQKMNPEIINFKINGLDDDSIYQIDIRKYQNNLTIFGGLINTLLPFHVNERGFLIQTIAKHKQIDGEEFSYRCHGKALRVGAIKLNQQWNGTGYNNKVSVYRDFNSHLFIIKKVEE